MQQTKNKHKHTYNRGTLWLQSFRHLDTSDVRQVDKKLSDAPVGQGQSPMIVSQLEQRTKRILC